MNTLPELETPTISPRPESGSAEVLHQAVLLYDELALTLPPIPADLGDRVVILRPGLVGTPNAPHPFELERCIEQLETDSDDYLVFGQDGHGATSQALHFCLLRPQLALFVQLEWGNAFMSSAAATSTHNALMPLCQELIELVHTVSVEPDQRLVVIQSDLATSRQGFVSRSSTLNEIANLKPEPLAISSAIETLKRKQASQRKRLGGVRV